MSGSLTPLTPQDIRDLWEQAVLGGYPNLSADDYERVAMFLNARANERDNYPGSADLVRTLRNILSVESKSWPAYVRTEFAAARALLERAGIGYPLTRAVAAEMGAGTELGAALEQLPPEHRTRAWRAHRQVEIRERVRELIGPLSTYRRQELWEIINPLLTGELPEVSRVVESEGEASGER